MWCWLNSSPEAAIAFGTLILAVATVALAAVTAFQDSIRAVISHPKLLISIASEPPDCILTTLTSAAAHTKGINAIYARIRVGNVGNATATNVEVYGIELRREAAGAWETVSRFPPMNFQWANMPAQTLFFPFVGPGMSKHCDIVRVVEPAGVAGLAPQSQTPHPAIGETALEFLLQIAPNHRGHIVGPGCYRLDILVSAANARPVKRTLEIFLSGQWHQTETVMLGSGFRMRLLD